MSAYDRAIAFDLDMTLVDSRPSSKRALERMVAEHGYAFNIPSLMARYGLPLSQWLPDGTDHVLFRALQMEEIASTEPMPGAAEAVDAARRSGSRAVVVTAAPDQVTREILRVVGISVDTVRANVWAEGKAKALQEESCWVYVGDHPDDMAAAHVAGAIAIGVATGTSQPIGADVEFADLTAFAPWLTEHLKKAMPEEGLEPPTRGL